MLLMDMLTNQKQVEDHHFETFIDRAQGEPLTRGILSTLQVNLGKRCNMACLHCHVEAGPKRTEEMSAETVSEIIDLLKLTPQIKMLDLTGGAPELNPHFRYLVQEATKLGCRVIDRCNLTILQEPGQEDLAEFLATHHVDIVASLPCYLEDNVDQQRGKGSFEHSIAALKQLNQHGYGIQDSGLTLNLVYNPIGPSLPPAQDRLEEAYHRELFKRYSIYFSHLLTITNMPIKRFNHQLKRDGMLEAYQSLLTANFNPETISGLMCRDLVSVGWDGKLYDCDFNQMLELPIAAMPKTISELLKLAKKDELRRLERAPITVASHCFGCTAGAGSSCGGALS